MYRMIMDHYNEDEDVYLAEEYVNQNVEDDEMSPSEAWFIKGWKKSM